MKIVAVLATLIATTLISCAAPHEIADFPPWDTGYDGFVGSVDITAGVGAINCGFFDLTGGYFGLVASGSPSEDQAAGFNCARSAYRSGVNFKYGSVRLPTDSFAWEVLVRSKYGDNWLIVYDVMIDGTAPQIWFKKCQSVIFYKSWLTYEGRNCQKYDGSEDPVWNTT